MHRGKGRDHPTPFRNCGRKLFEQRPNERIVMGMFDYLRCRYPLPMAGANDRDFQSKDTPSQYMESYEIREDGSLWLTTMDGAAIEPMRCLMTGEIGFHDYDPKQEPEWVEFMALVVKGQVVRMEQISPDPDYREGAEL